MTKPLKMPAPIKHIARLFRDAPASNHLISSIVRGIPDTTFRRGLMSRIPRIGRVSVPLPDGSPMIMECGSAESVTTSVFYDGWMGEEPEVLPIWRELAAEARVVLDIGAHVGHFSLVAGLTNPALDIHCFEPLPRVAKLLRRNLALNGIQADVREIALTKAAGQLTFYAVSDGIPSSSSLSKDFMNKEHGVALDEITVMTSTLDDLFPDPKGPVLIKIDTETTEPDVLSGGHAFIGRTKPVIIVEVLVKHETGPALHRELEQAGYNFTPYLITGNGLLEKQRIGADPHWRNFLLMPKDGPFATERTRQILRDHN